MNIENRLLSLGMCLSLLAATAGAQSAEVDLSKGWKFQTGDDASWSTAQIDEADWKTIRVGASWESQGYENYNGYAWYRLHVDIPATIKQSAVFQKNKLLKLALGKIDDVDQTWVNGKRIGETGTMPEPYQAAWDSDREYLVPADVIRWDEENVIAVRVYDGRGDGGMISGDYMLKALDASEFLTIDFHLGRGDGIFVSQGGMPISATLKNKADAQVAGDLFWTIENDEGKELKRVSSALELSPKSATTVICSHRVNEPGFYRVKLSIRSPEGTQSTPKSMVLGYQPEKIQSSITAQPDLDAFWQETLQQLASVEPQYKMTPQPDGDTVTHQLYLVEMRSLNDVRVRGWYQKPKAAGKHPALLRVPGYTQAMQPTTIRDAIAVFSFNVRGHGNSQDDVKGQPVDYWIRGLDDKEGYFYQGAYADCVRAVDFLASRSEVDAKRIGVTGGSQGGGFSLMTAALDPRISLCAPDIPFLCDWKKYFKAGHWPEMEGWIEKNSDRTWESTLQTMGYFDALNFAHRIKCPVFLGVGLQDATCPAATIFSVYNRLKVPKQYFVYPNAGHWVGAEHEGRRRSWMLKQFGLN